MPKYLLVREVGELTEEDIKAGFAGGEEVGEKMPNMKIGSPPEGGC